MWLLSGVSPRKKKCEKSLKIFEKPVKKPVVTKFSRVFRGSENQSDWARASSSVQQFEISQKGPHGQVRGLRESVVLAIKLNRTLVIPTFFIDGWDDPVQLSSALVWDKTQNFTLISSESNPNLS